MKLRITVLPGDGIGPEVTAEAVSVLEAVARLFNHEVGFKFKDIGGCAIRRCNDPSPEDTLNGCLEGDAVLLGAVGHPEFDSYPTNTRPEAGLLRLRNALGAFAHLRPARSFEARRRRPPPPPERSNRMRYPDQEIERIARLALELARTRRRKVTSVDKANVLECSALWRETATRVAREYSDVILEHLYVDSCAMALVARPASFDVMLAENTFGDIISDEAGAIVGSLG